MTKREFGKLIGAQVEALRLKSRMSVRQLAREAGMAQAPIAKLCNGASTQVSVYTLAGVATALGVSMDVLAGREAPHA